MIFRLVPMLAVLARYIAGRACLDSTEEGEMAIGAMFDVRNDKKIGIEIRLGSSHTKQKR
jgi:hypothetical protein